MSCISIFRCKYVENSSDTYHFVWSSTSLWNIFPICELLLLWFNAISGNDNSNAIHPNGYTTTNTNLNNSNIIVMTQTIIKFILLTAAPSHLGPALGHYHGCAVVLLLVENKRPNKIEKVQIPKKEKWLNYSRFFFQYFLETREWVPVSMKRDIDTICCIYIACMKYCEFARWMPVDWGTMGFRLCAHKGKYFSKLIMTWSPIRLMAIISIHNNVLTRSPYYEKALGWLL